MSSTTCETKNINSLKSLIKKLYPLWRNGNAAVLIHTESYTASFNNFSCIEQIDNFLMSASLYSLYIKTIHGEWNIPLDKYETYKFNKDCSLTIVCSNNEYKIIF